MPEEDERSRYLLIEGAAIKAPEHRILEAAHIQERVGKIEQATRLFVDKLVEKGAALTEAIGVLLGVGHALMQGLEPRQRFDVAVFALAVAEQRGARIPELRAEVDRLSAQLMALDPELEVIPRGGGGGEA